MGCGCAKRRKVTKKPSRNKGSSSKDRARGKPIISIKRTKRIVKRRG